MRNCAVIIETRRIPGIGKIIKNHMSHLPGWDLKIICCNSNYYHIFQSLLENGMSKKFDDDNFIFLNSGNLSAYEYNKILTSNYFWRTLNYDKVLIFQSDSFIRRDGIEEFMDYEYVGSPWTFQEHGGNGGLSLRSVAIMRTITDTFIWTPQDGNEDIWFSNIMKRHMIGKLAPRDVCMKFGVETVYYEDPFGCHSVEKYHSPELVSKLKEGTGL